MEYIFINTLYTVIYFTINTIYDIIMYCNEM